MRLKLYLDTSVLGAICDPGPEERLVATRRLLVGLSERRSLAVLEESPESLALAQTYVSAGAIPADYEDDARHIAIATVNDIRVVVSWNFRHMVNIERKRRINSVNLREGLPLLDLVSPWEVSDEEA